LQLYTPTSKVSSATLHKRQKKDVEKILTASSLGELDETTRTLSYYVNEDYPAGPEIQQPLPE